MIKAPEKLFLNSKEASIVMGISEKQLRNLTSLGVVPYYKFGRLNRYKLDELIALIESNPRGLKINRSSIKEYTDGN